MRISFVSFVLFRKLQNGEGWMVTVIFGNDPDDINVNLW
jgi:hypothetical protein